MAVPPPEAGLGGSIADGPWLPCSGCVTATASGEAPILYNPATGTWSMTGSLHLGRGAFASVKVANDKVLVLGGFDGMDYISSVERYEPTTGTWTEVGPLLGNRGYHHATVLSSGKVLVTGGWP